MFFLGIDCSTQSLKLQVINESKEKIKEVIINYDQDLKHYNTVDGIIRHEKNGFEHISTPSLLFVEALEIGIEKLKNEFDLSKILAISGSGQQHGSVYWRTNSLQLLSKTNDKNFVNQSNDKKLFELLASTFSLSLSPIWMDSSTTIECNEITDCVGSAQKLADLTGSHAYERFTGPQIKHLYKHQPDVYHNTERISLISSFLASLLIGDYAPIDYSDGSGMNILDIHTFKWSETILNTIAPDLKQKLGEPIKSSAKIGFISSYWQIKHGFSSACQIYAFSGDNPCSLVGLDLNKLGDVAISLGTSDVLFAVTDLPKPNASEGSILIHPQDINQYMMMLVYKNGATTRNFIKNSIFKLDNDWSKFNQAIKSTPAGNNEHVGFYFREKEITPQVFQTGFVKFNNLNDLISNELNESDCRGIIESQALSYKLHSKLLGLNKISSLVITGGGSVNREILQIIADVFECQVRPSNVANTAASGAAIRALTTYFSDNNNKQVTEGVSSLSNEIIEPNTKNYSVYRHLFERYEKLEKLAIQKLNI